MSAFNPANIAGVLLNGGKSLYVQSGVATAQGLKVDGSTVIPGLRFKSNVEGRTLWAFTPFAAMVGIIGTAEGEPQAEPSVNFDPSGLVGIFVLGGRLFRVRSAELVSSAFGDSLRMTYLSDTGRDEQATVALSQVIAFLGDFRTDAEREADAQDKAEIEAVDFMATYGTDSKTYAAAMAKQTTYDKATKETSTVCAACAERFPSSAYHVPVFIKGVGIVHRSLPCNPFSRKGLLAHNGVAG